MLWKDKSFRWIKKYYDCESLSTSSIISVSKPSPSNFSTNYFLYSTIPTHLMPTTCYLSPSTSVLPVNATYLKQEFILAKNGSRGLNCVNLVVFRYFWDARVLEWDKILFGNFTKKLMQSVWASIMCWGLSTN